MLELIARLTIEGQFDPSELTRTLGTEPSKTWRQGDMRFNRPSEVDVWSLEVSTKSKLYVEHLIETLLKSFEPRWNELIVVSQQFNILLSCIIYSSGERPAFYLDRVLLQRIASINAGIDVDLYVLPGDEDA